jgi:hypothetical protein
MAADEAREQALGALVDAVVHFGARHAGERPALDAIGVVDSAGHQTSNSISRTSACRRGP